MKIFSCALFFLIGSFSVQAEEMMSHAQHMGSPGNDTRLMLDYPPDVRVHALANMRSHLQALAEVMQAFAEGKYAEAADIADSRLGMDSNGSAGCRPGTKKMDMKMSSMTEADHLNHQMALLMPDKMRELGQNMHKSANDFAAKARDAETDSKKIKEAEIALAKIPQQCVACHAAYRMQ